MMKASAIGLISALALSASAMAQTPEMGASTTNEPRPAEPAESLPSAVETVAPTDRNKPEDIAAQPNADDGAEPGTLAASVPRATPPVNICGELIAFLTPEPAQNELAAVSDGAPDGAKPAPPVGQNSPPQEASREAVEAQQDSGSAQEASAQSGVAVEAPKSDVAAATASGQNAPQTSGQSAPIPQPPEKSEPAPSMTSEQAQDLAASNDIAGCRAAAQKMRRAGVALPNPLIALAALEVGFLERAAPVADPSFATPAQ